MPKLKKADEDWEAVVNGARIGIGRVFKDLYNQQIDPEDLDKLFNFTQTAFALMQVCGPQKWAMAKMNAELMSYMKGGDES